MASCGAQVQLKSSVLYSWWVSVSLWSICRNDLTWRANSNKWKMFLQLFPLHSSPTTSSISDPINSNKNRLPAVFFATWILQIYWITLQIPNKPRSCTISTFLSGMRWKAQVFTAPLQTFASLITLQTFRIPGEEEFAFVNGASNRLYIWLISDLIPYQLSKDRTNEWVQQLMIKISLAVGLASQQLSLCDLFLEKPQNCLQIYDSSLFESATKLNESMWCVVK